MAADCEIDDCGVLAIGRCLRCGRPMCTSHRALTPQGGPVIDQCTQCQTAIAKEGRDRSQREALEAEVARRARQDRMRTAKRAILSLIRQLAAAGHRPDKKIRHAQKQVEVGWWTRRTESREDPENHLYGWFVGTYTWEYSAMSGDRPREDRTSELRTYITLDRRLATEDRGPLWSDVRGMEVGIDPDREPPGRIYIDWEQVLARLTTIARELGVHAAEGS